MAYPPATWNDNDSDRLEQPTDHASKVAAQTVNVVTSLVVGGVSRMSFPLKATGYDQTAEIQQYFNDSNAGNVYADFGPGDFIITGDITVYARRVAEYESNYGYGINMRGIGPNATRLLDCRATKTTPVILITEPTGVDTGNRAEMVKLSDFSLLSCNTSGVINPLGTLSGVGIMAKATTGTGYGAHVLHQAQIERVLFSGHDYPLSLDDSTQVLISHCRFTEFLTAIRMGGNADLWEINHCGFGSESFASSYRNSSVAIDMTWDAGIIPTGSANCLTINSVWAMKIGEFLKTSQGHNPVVIRNGYFENVRRYYYANVADTSECAVVFDACHFSAMGTNDFTSAAKANANYGSKIQFGNADATTTASSTLSPKPVLTLRNCTGDGTPTNAPVTFTNRNGHIVWENNKITAASTYLHLRCLRDGYESWRWMASTDANPSAGPGKWTVGDDQAAGLRILSGDPMIKAATIASAGTYNIDHVNGTVFELTLPDGNCTIDYAAYAAGPPSPLLGSGTEIDVILICPGTVSASRTITWGARMSMGAATLAFTTTEQGKRAQFKIRAPKDSGSIMQIVSRDPVFI